MDIKLKFHNFSESGHLYQIVFFQKNIATDFDNLITAWKVIQSCGYANYHPFEYTSTSYISASDSYGNFTPHLCATPGDAFEVVPGRCGHQLRYRGTTQSVTDIELVNHLERGAVTANIFKADRLLARKTALAPGQKAVFRFKPVLYAALTQGITEGHSLEAAAISDRAGQLGLLGMASADILLTGGGSGADARAFSFELDHVVWV